MSLGGPQDKLLLAEKATLEVRMPAEPVKCAVQ